MPQNKVLLMNYNKVQIGKFCLNYTTKNKPNTRGIKLFFSEPSSDYNGDIILEKPLPTKQQAYDF